MPQMREVMTGISRKERPSQNFSKPRNSVTWKRASTTCAGVVELDGDLGVPLDAGDRVDEDAFGSWRHPKWSLAARGRRHAPGQRVDEERRG